MQDAKYHPIYLHHVVYMILGLLKAIRPQLAQPQPQPQPHLRLQVGLGAIHQDPIALCKDAAVLCTHGEPERARHVTLHVQPLC